MILTKEAIEFVSRKLRLPFQGTEQDWEVELADPKRIDEFVAFYKKTFLSVHRKRALMALILASYDEFLNIHGVDTSNLWHRIACLVRPDKDIFVDILDYWSLRGETDPENYFKLTPLIKSIA